MRTVHLYRCFNKDGVLLYIGGSMFFQHRILALRSKNEWFNDVTIIQIEHFKYRDDMRAAERRAIATESPIYNRMGNPKKVEIK